MTPSEAAAARGAEKLDSAFPNWWRKVTQPLDMYSSTRCVLGQVYGWYGAGVTALEGDETFFEFARAHGFSSKSIKDMEELDRIWSELIYDRRCNDHEEEDS